MQSQWKAKTRLGELYFLASEKGLQAVGWEKYKAPFASSLEQNKHLSAAVAQMEEYVSGERKQFDLDFDIEGTEFQKKVWSALAKIPYGKTLSYRDVARKIKKEKAVRAVGGANGKNPLCIIVPCHRVIAADGTIGGYSGGLDRKRALLALEQNQN